jgi:hypothetical protein
VKMIKLNKGYSAKVSNKDYTRVAQHTWHEKVMKNKDGSIKNVYAARNTPYVNGKRKYQRMHRFILSITDPKIQVDHRDGDGLNNQRRNIRRATQAQNSYNKFQKNNTSGFTGIYRRDNGWQVSIGGINKRMNLGTFSSKEQAINARRIAEKKYAKNFSYQESRQ